MNIESATGTFVFTLVFEKYTKENIYQILNAFFLLHMYFYGQFYFIDPP